MQLDSSGAQSLTLPLNFIIPSGKGDFASKARVLFHPAGNTEVIDGSYIFKDQILEYLPVTLSQPETGKTTGMQEASLPVFSFTAIVLLIVFRNIFYKSFLKYFFSLQNNYEIDFNVQKIGFPPLVMAILIILLAISDYLRSPASPPIGTILRTIQLVGSPMAISMAALFLFSLSIRFFPIIFPDIKVLFFIAVMLLAYNCAVFGLDGRMPLEIRFFLPALGALFFILRSFFLFMVFRKFFRYRSALSLFYICTLNLSTCLVLFEILK